MLLLYLCSINIYKRHLYVVCVHLIKKTEIGLVKYVGIFIIYCKENSRWIILSAITK